MNQVRWGIIGCGDVCEKKSGPALYKTAGSVLLSVMRRDAAKAADFAKRHGVARSSDDASAIIDDPEIDIVYIATPPGTHCDYALRVAAAGKHCYVEKPMARNGVEAARMVDAFASAGRKLFVAYYRRRLPVFLRARQLLEDGAIGKLTGICHRHTSPAHRRTDGWRVDAEQSGGGIFMDLASHVFDVLDYITGPFSDVAGHAANIASDYAVEDTVSVAWRNPAGVVGSSHWNFASDVADERIELLGTEGSIMWRAFGTPILRLTRGTSVQEFNEPYPEHVHQPLVQTIVDELLGRGSDASTRCPSTGTSALRTQIVLDQCLAGYYGGRSDEFWLRQDNWPGRRR
ncbi:MAG: Gfo/Idh/MocA family oxidoreductase [Burkholderiales bacterium]|nr:Gfo/Idh/MocA family oxidoreductase [Phycisphaerae bacterium]